MSRILSLLFLISLLASCGGPNVCIYPDDFGNLDKLFISAEGTSVVKENDIEISGWETYGSKVISGVEPLRIEVVTDHDNGSNWIFWGKENASYYTKDKKFKAEDLPYCYFDVNYAPKYSVIPKFADGRKGTPCKFRNGVGLMMVVHKADLKLNESTASKKDPISAFDSINSSDYLHLGYDPIINGNNAPIQFYGQDAGGINFESPPADWTGKKISFKILDDKYGDNQGGYEVIIRTGLKKKENPINYYFSKVNELTKNIAKRIFVEMVGNDATKIMIKLTLLIFVIINAILFLMGLIRPALHELILRMFKVGLVMMVLTPDVWDFFYDNFLQVFLDGSLELAQAVSGVKEIDSNGFGRLFDILINMQIFYKILGTATSFQNVGAGILILIIIMVSYLLFIPYTLKTVFIFVLALLSIALLTILTPIMVVFKLFKLTGQIADGWIKWLISYMLQTIIVLIYYTFLFSMLATFLENNLGYKVCWKEDQRFGLYNWQAQVSNRIEKIKVPGYFIQGEKECKPYQCESYRYVDMPYLIPDHPNVKNERHMWSLTNGNDQDRINEMLKDGVGISFKYAITFLLFGIIVKLISKVIISLALILTPNTFSWGHGLADATQAAQNFDPYQALQGIAMQSGLKFGKYLWSKGILKKAGKLPGKAIKKTLMAPVNATKGIYNNRRIIANTAVEGFNKTKRGVTKIGNKVNNFLGKNNKDKEE